MKKTKKGFTIIELLAAIVVIGILASLAVLFVQRYILQGHNEVDKQIEKQLVLSAKSYYSDNQNSFKNVDETGVVIWYTTLKANDYISNDLVDSDGNSCSKSYVVYNEGKYTSCIICDNDGYSNTSGKKECTESLNNYIKCEFKDAGEIKLGINSGFNQATLEMSCTGRNILFNDGKTAVDDGMFRASHGTVSISSDSTSYGKDKNNHIRSFTTKVLYTAVDASTGKGSVTFESSAYVVDNKNSIINNEEITYSNISIDGAGPTCKLTGPYKDSNLSTTVKSVKGGSVVYYGLSCSDESGIGELTTTDLKNGFKTSDAISNLTVSNLNKSSDNKTITSTVSVTVSNPNINASKKVFDFSLVFNKDVVKDSYDNGNEEISSEINGKASVLSIDDQGPTCSFNGPAYNATFTTKKSKIDVTQSNEYAYYELRCTDENGIDASTFKFSDIKSYEFGKIVQSGDRDAIKDNDGNVIGYRYLIIAYKKDVTSLITPVEAYLTYDASNVKDTVGNNGSNTYKSSTVKMIDGSKVPTCSISVSYSNGYAIISGTMSSSSELKGYAWSTDYGDPSSYNSASGTYKSVSTYAYSNGTYYLHVIDENDLTGYCRTDSYIYIPSPDTPIITASDSISSGSWHNSNYSLYASGVSGSVTYYYGTSSYSLTSTSSPYVSSETSGTTYYAKACWSNNSNICSSSAQYLAKLDKTPPTCSISKTKYGSVCPSDVVGDSYTFGNWTQCGVNVKIYNCSDSLSGMSSSNSFEQNYYTENIHTVSTSSIKDNAGNTYTASGTIKIDRTTPKVNWSVSDGATVYVGDTVSFSCSDADSGIGGWGGMYINGNYDTTYGTSVTFATTGTKKLYAVCVDIAGNSTADNKSAGNAEITVYVKKKTYFFSSNNSGSGTCSSGNCCNSSPTTCSASTHGQMKYTGCSAEKKTTTTYSYSWKTSETGGSSGTVSKSTADEWCVKYGYTATYKSCDSTSCTSSRVGSTCRTATGANGSKVYCTIKECTSTASTSTSYTGKYTYSGSYQCLYKVED